MASRRLLLLPALAALGAAQDVPGPLLPSYGCDMKGLQSKLDAVETACCGMDDACIGVPESCSVPCALVFAPFYSQCGVMMGRLLDDDAAGSAEVQAFDALNDQCAGAVDLGSALGMLREFLEDDHDLLLPALDGFETYRHFDPLTVQSQHGAMSTSLTGCVQGWTATGEPPCGMPPMGPQESCCISATGQCGQRCPNTPNQPGDPCVLSNMPDMSDCPAPPAPPHDEITSCTHEAGAMCTPRECAAVCSAARGCVSFRYQKQQETYSNGQQPSQMCCGMGAQPPPAEDPVPRSYCSFSFSCTTDSPRTAFPPTQNSPCTGQSSPWNFYMKREVDGSGGGDGGGKH